MTDPELRLKLLGREITLAEAREEEDNILQQLSYPRLRLEFCLSILKKKDELHDLIASHLNIDPKACRLSSYEHWRHGSFNFAIPFHVD